MFEDERLVIEAARRWVAAIYGAEKRSVVEHAADHLFTVTLAFERGRKLKSLRPRSSSSGGVGHE